MGDLDLYLQGHLSRFDSIFSTFEPVSTITHQDSTKPFQICTKYASSSYLNVKMRITYLGSQSCLLYSHSLSCTTDCLAEGQLHHAGTDADYLFNRWSQDTNSEPIRRLKLKSWMRNCATKLKFATRASVPDVNTPLPLKQ